MKIATVLAAVTVALAALIASVSAAENPPNPEQSERASNAIETELLLRSACKEYVAAYTAQETIEGLADWNDPSKVPSLWEILQGIWSRLSDAEQKVINHLSDDEIAQLREIASVQRAVQTALEDGDWPFMGKVHDLLRELQGNAQDAREAATVHFCTRGRRAE